MTAISQPKVIAFLAPTGPGSVALDEARAVLADDELLRGNRFVFREDAERWLRSRYWVRVSLARQLGVNPRTIAFASNRWGKPRLAGLQGDLEFNVSHSGDWVAIALTPCGEVGIDIEVTPRDFPALEVAEEFFTAQELALLQNTNGYARQRLFIQLWTAKEALMKATGLGVGLLPDAIDVRSGELGPEGYVAQKDFSLVQKEWRPGLWVAIAMRCPPFAVDWRELGADGGSSARVA